jgi:proline dehydrogenase
MLNALSKAFFLTLASNRPLKRLASRYGLRKPTSFGRRFIAGESTADAIEAARAVQAAGLYISLDLLGESVLTLDEADAATRGCLALVRDVVDAGIERNISIKLTQLGLDVDHATAVDNLRKVLAVADRHDFFIRIDMEGSAYTQETLDIWETLWGLGHRRLGVVLQSALHRSEADALRVIERGGRIRLVKGAYKEPKTIAYQQKAEVDEAFVRIMRILLERAEYPAIATHDPAMIAATKARAAELGLAPDRFEFQMLYGVRRDLQAALAAEGYRVRVYIPFGREWFPYFMRRLAERPANVGFVVRSLLREG